MEALITLYNGRPVQKARGEAQETVDIGKVAGYAQRDPHRARTLLVFAQYNRLKLVQGHTLLVLKSLGHLVGSQAVGQLSRAGVAEAACA